MTDRATYCRSGAAQSIADHHQQSEGYSRVFGPTRQDDQTRHERQRKQGHKLRSAYPNHNGRRKMTLSRAEAEISLA